ncbi:DUF222 domain-containing protein [Nocardioides pyridinolyticus]
MAATTRTRADRAEEVLVAARDNQRAIADLEIERLLLAVEWAAMFEGEEPDPDDWATHPVEIAGDGAPWVDESAVAEFALALGMKHETGIRYVGDAIELRYRLPRIWRRVMAGEVAVFKARKIAQDTRTLSMDAAAAVDRHLALIARRRSWAEIERQITRARAEYDPEEAERRRIAAAEKRCIEVHYRGISPDGAVPITGYASLADALAFDQFLTATAATLDPALPLDVRRSDSTPPPAFRCPQTAVTTYPWKSATPADPRPSSRTGQVRGAIAISVSTGQSQHRPAAEVQPESLGASAQSRTCCDSRLGGSPFRAWRRGAPLG